MPRRDGTGPMGMGSITGRGAGYCTGYTSSEFTNRKFGFGRGNKRMFCLTGMPRWSRTDYSPVMSGGQMMDEKTILKNQEEFLEKQLQNVKERIKNFDEEK